MLEVCLSIYFCTHSLVSCTNLCLILLYICQVLYKSRCDNKLNEITERAIADKREVCCKRCNTIIVILDFDSWWFAHNDSFDRLGYLPKSMKRNTSKLQK